MNWQVIGQLTALALILASGPIVIILLSTKRDTLL